MPPREQATAVCSSSSSRLNKSSGGNSGDQGPSMRLLDGSIPREVLAIVWSKLDKHSLDNLRQTCKALRDCPDVLGRINTLTLQLQPLEPGSRGLSLQLLAWPKKAAPRKLRIGCCEPPTQGLDDFRLRGAQPLSLQAFVDAALHNPQARRILTSVQILQLQDLSNVGEQPGEQLAQLFPQLERVEVCRYRLSDAAQLVSRLQGWPGNVRIVHLGVEALGGQLQELLGAAMASTEARALLSQVQSITLQRWADVDLPAHAQLQQLCPQLQQVVVHQHEIRDVEGIGQLASSLEGWPTQFRLHELYIRGSYREQLAVIDEASASTGARAFLCTTKTLLLWPGMWNGNPPEEAEGGLGIAVAELCPSLQVLDQDAADDQIISLTELAPLSELHTLRLATCAFHASMLQIPAQLPAGLRRLKLEISGDHGVQYDIRALTGLKELEELVLGPGEVPDEEHCVTKVSGLSMLAQGCAKLRYLHLQHVHLTACDPGCDGSSPTTGGESSNISSGSKSSGSKSSGLNSVWWPALETVQLDGMEAGEMAKLQLHLAPKLRQLGRFFLGGQENEAHLCVWLRNSSQDDLQTLCLQLANSAQAELVCPKTIDLLLESPGGEEGKSWGPLLEALSPVAPYLQRLFLTSLQEPVCLSRKDVSRLATTLPDLQELIMSSGDDASFMREGALTQAVLRLPQLRLVQVDVLEDSMEAATAALLRQQAHHLGQGVQALTMGVSHDREKFMQAKVKYELNAAEAMFGEPVVMFA